MAFRSSSQLVGSNTTSAAVPVPTGAASGDIAVVAIYMESTATITTVPSGFQTPAKADLQTSATSRGRLVVYWKRLTAGDTGTYTFSWSGATWRSAACGLWSGRVASGDPFDGTVGTGESTTTVSASPAVSTTPSGSNGDAVFFATDFTGGNSWTPPTNYTERQDNDEITLASRDAVASGSTGSVTATLNVSGFSKAFVGVLAVAASGFTGTAAVTQADNTSSASGQLGYTGTVAETQADNTSSASGTVANPVTGTAAIAQANNTAAASGVLGYTGTVARTQAANTSTATGVLGYTGTLARTQQDQTSTASGTVTAAGFTGSVAVTQPNNTSSASGILGYSGTLAKTQANNIASASGLVGAGFLGSVAVTQANQTANATGLVGNIGSASIAQASNIVSAAGKLGYTGTLARTQAANTATATGVVANPVTGTVAVQQANQTASATGTTQPLVLYGTSSAGVGIVPSSHPNAGLAPYSTPATASTPSASGSSTGVPTSTGA